MIFDQTISLLTSYAGAIAVVLYVAGVLVLLHSMRVQDQSTRSQTATIKQLREHLGHSVKAQVELHDHVNLLHERYNELLARQQRVETRTPDSRRIDTAMRMLRRGTADTQTLQDLGLSHGEAKLLMRLHGTRASATAAGTQRRPVVDRVVNRDPAPGKSPASCSHRATTHDRVHGSRPPVAAQGRALAQLLEA